MALNLTINGEPRSFDDDALTITALIDALGLGGRRVAVEVNQRIVKRADHADHSLADGDVLEIVHFVGGG